MLSNIPDQHVLAAAEGLITYIRTDSPAMDADAVQEVRQAISDVYGSKFLASGPLTYQ